MVDERQIAFRPAVEVSYLTEEQQYTLLEAMAVSYTHLMVDADARECRTGGYGTGAFSI